MLPLSALSAFALLFPIVSAITLQVSNSGGNATSPYQYGLIYEDINRAGDGGIYGELIQNRAFQADDFSTATTSPFVALPGSTISLNNTAAPLSSALPWSMTVSGSGNSTGFSNPGYFGIPVTAQTYQGTFWVLGQYTGHFTASFVSDTTGETLASTTFAADSNTQSWTQQNYSLTVSTAATDVNNSLVISFDAGEAQENSLNFNFISLFPPTYKDRANGNRIDLMEAIGGVHPSFLRLPGGNNLEGESPPEQFIWNNTIGPQIDRQGRDGDWGYYNTNGFGLAELLNWCVDLDMEPVLAVFDGHWLNGQTVTGDDLQPYIDSALNELEYILGSTSTQYGALRASHGFPDPWEVKYVEIGNEDNLSNGQDTYQSRFTAFESAINSAYPDITVIASTTQVQVGTGSFVDYHLYATPDTLVEQFSFFDQNDPSVKTLVGELAALAANGSPDIYNVNRFQFPVWIGTVAEAIFYLGLERNAPSILGVAYAPILQNTASVQWTPDLISFTADPADTVHSTSWTGLELLSGTRIANVRPTTAGSTDTIGPAYWVAGTTSSGAGVLKAAVYNATEDVPFAVTFEGSDQGAAAQLTVLTAPSPYSSASVGSNPVVTNTTTLTSGTSGFEFSLPNYSIAVLETM